MRVPTLQQRFEPGHALGAIWSLTHSLTHIEDQLFSPLAGGGTREQTGCADGVGVG